MITVRSVSPILCDHIMIVLNAKTGLTIVGWVTEWVLVELLVVSLHFFLTGVSLHSQRAWQTYGRVMGVWWWEFVEGLDMGKIILVPFPRLVCDGN